MDTPEQQLPPPAKPPRSADTVTIPADRYHELVRGHKEYGVTITTLALVSERLLAAEGDGDDTLWIEPADRLNAPDLRAGATPDGRIWIKVSR